MLHPDFELRVHSDEIGFGVFAKNHVPKGTIVWTLDPLDRVITPEEEPYLMDRMGPTLLKYGYIDGSGQRIICWDFARYMNHHCEPASLGPGLTFEMAVRDLAPGDELTCDYGALNIEATFECLCGSSVCRGSVHPEDFDKHAERWDTQLRDAIVDVMTVAQPLWPLVAHKTEIRRSAVCPDELPSILGNRFPGIRSQAVNR